jgi:hypothetical protein
MSDIKPLDELQRYLLLGAIFQAVTTQLEVKPEPPQSPYQGYEGQRPGESFTAWRQRVRKEQTKI